MSNEPGACERPLSAVLIDREQTCVRVPHNVDRTTHVIRRRILYSLLLLISAGLTGCEEDLVSRDRVVAPFSIYCVLSPDNGALSPDLTTQSIRAYPYVSTR